METVTEILRMIVAAMGLAGICAGTTRIFRSGYVLLITPAGTRHKSEKLKIFSCVAFWA